MLPDSGVSAPDGGESNWGWYTKVNTEFAQRWRVKNDP